jgi:hypothetical protein
MHHFDVEARASLFQKNLVHLLHAMVLFIAVLATKTRDFYFRAPGSLVVLSFS